MTIRILAEVTLSDSQINGLEDTISQLMVDSRHDQGCLQYDVFKKADGFVFIEHWQNEADLKTHEATPHFQHFKQVLQATKAQLRVEILSAFSDSIH